MLAPFGCTPTEELTWFVATGDQATMMHRIWEAHIAKSLRVRPESDMEGEFQKAADVSEIPQGTMKIVKLMGHEISIANVEGQFHAFSNSCTHAGGPLGRGKLEGFVVQCPLHGSKFDVRTGAVVGHPAQAPVRTFVVKVEKGTVWVKSTA